MSGQIQGRIEGEYYGVVIGGRVVGSPMFNPEDTEEDHARRRENAVRAQAPYYRWAELAKAPLDALFEQLVAEGVPLVPLSPEVQLLDGTILEDTSSHAKLFDHFDRGGPYLVRLHGGRRMPGIESLALDVHVSRRVHRAEMDAVVQRVVDTLLRHRP
jgi:hypothetical protein